MDFPRIKQLRESTGLTAKAFAAKLNIPYTTYYGYESGAREPGHSFLVLMSNEFDISTDYLLGLTDVPTRQSAKKEPPAISNEIADDPRFTILAKNYATMNNSGKIALVQYSEVMMRSGMYDEHSNVPNLEKQA